MVEHVCSRYKQKLDMCIYLFHMYVTLNLIGTAYMYFLSISCVLFDVIMYFVQSVRPTHVIYFTIIHFLL